VNGLIKKGFKAEDIVLLDYSGASEMLAESKKIAGLSAFSWTVSPRKNVIRYTTVRKFKGMEGVAVVIYNVSGMIEKDDPLFYVAVTRPKVSLTILADSVAINSISALITK
jgi:DNA helicase IV